MRPGGNMRGMSMDRIDSDYAQYTRGEITRGELYKRWKKRHAVGLLKAIWRDLVLDMRAIRRDFKSILGQGI